MIRFVAARLVLPAALVLAALSGTTTARAATTERDSNSVQVSLAGLDLSSSADQATARHRIRLAAIRACDGADPRDLSSSAAFESCRDDATSPALNTLAERIAAARTASGAVRVASASR